MKRKKNDMSLGEVIDHYLRNHKMYGRFKEQEAVAAWPAVMGETIARHTMDISIRKGILYIKLDSAVLRKELEMGKDKIVRMLNEKVDEQVINTVRFL